MALYADVDPQIKRMVDHWAAIADVKVWEVVEELVRLAQATEGRDGLPAGMHFSSAQPALDVESTPQGGAVAA